jgi:hypothetical protein
LSNYGHDAKEAIPVLNKIIYDDCDDIEIRILASKSINKILNHGDK